jgi:5-formyltetrahydrofolate cyclo-ligase
MPEYLHARNISVYMSMASGEVITKAIVYDALQRGKNVFVPYIYKNKSTGPRSLMDMVELRSEEDFKALEPDRWGIPSIDPGSVAQRTRCLCESFETEAEDPNPPRRENLDLIVVPGLAFDRTRHRLGHGKGYYDIFLSQYREHKGTDTEIVEMPYLGGYH